MSSPRLRSGVVLSVYAGWTVGVLSAYYAIPDALIVGLNAPAFGGAHAAEAAVTAARSFGGAITVLAAAYASGTLATIVCPLPFTLRPERISYTLAIGFITLALASQGLAYFELYSVTAVRALVIALSIAGGAHLLHRRARVLAGVRMQWNAPLFGGLVVAALGFALIGSLAPESEYDALWYHLWLPQRWLEAAGPVDMVEEYVSLYPLSWDLAYGAALTLGGAGAAKLLHFACLPLLACATWLLCREIAPRSDPVLAAAITVTTPTVLWEATTAYVDLALAWYVALAAYALIRYFRGNERSWLLVSALVLGGALAIKHLALVAALILGSTLVLTTLVRATAVAAARRGLLFTVIALAIPLPWYARAYAASGNPVFPDLYIVFGADPPERWNELTERGLAKFKSRFGRERTVSNLVVLPWDVTVHGAQYGGSLGPLFLLLVPAAFVRRGDVLPNVVAGAVAAYIVVWASPVSSFQMRFLLPAVPFLAVLAAAGFEHLTRMASTFGRAAPPALVGVTTVLLTLNLPTFIEWHDGDRYKGGPWLTHVMRDVPLAVVTGGESQEDYLRRLVPSYAVWQYIDRHVPRDARVLTFSGGDHLYSARPRVWSDATIAHSLTWGAARGSEGDTLNRLHEFGITHVVLDERQVASGAMDGLALVSPELRECCFRELYRDSRYSLHALVSAVDLSRTKEPHCGTSHAWDLTPPLCDTEPE